jgi:hypothetical protein
MKGSGAWGGRIEQNRASIIAGSRFLADGQPRIDLRITPISVSVTRVAMAYRGTRISVPASEPTSGSIPRLVSIVNCLPPVRSESSVEQDRSGELFTTPRPNAERFKNSNRVNSYACVPRGVFNFDTSVVAAGVCAVGDNQDELA